MAKLWPKGYPYSLRLVKECNFDCSLLGRWLRHMVIGMFFWPNQIHCWIVSLILLKFSVAFNHIKLTSSKFKEVPFMFVSLFASQQGTFQFMDVQLNTTSNVSNVSLYVLLKFVPCLCWVQMNVQLIRVLDCHIFVTFCLQVSKVLGPGQVLVGWL